MVSDYVVNLCQATDTVSSVLATKPDEAPGEIVKRLYGNLPRDVNQAPRPSSQALETASRCGNWGPTSPSPLFLQAFADALECLDADPLSAMVSPPLMGSHGTMPLTVIAPLGDVARHCSNLIARAQTEVVLITSTPWWRPGRAGERRQRVVVKIMYDKAAPANVLDPYQQVKPARGMPRSLVQPAGYTSTSIQLPAPHHVPHIDLQVVSFHRLVLGTLHAKFCVVDRKMALVMSNNIEDNCNMEMMTHVQGPIVDSIYDTALITWNKTLSPSLPLPSHAATEAEGAPMPAGHEPVHVDGLDPVHVDSGQGQDDDQVAPHGHAQSGLAEHTPDDAHYDSDLAGEMVRMQSCYSTKPQETRLQAANRQLNLAAPKPVPPSGPDIADGAEMIPYLSTATAQPIPMALVSRPPYGPVDSSNGHVPQNEAWLSLIRHAQRDIFIQTPNLNAAPLLPALAAALKRGVEVTYYVCFGYNDAGEMMPGQGGTNEQAAKALVDSLAPNGPERRLLRIYNYVAKDQDHPIHQSLKSRACHIKLLIVDNAVGIQGSGNQDTQSWFHSQEMNVMIDSPEVCEKWRRGVDRNQNTKTFGRVSDDGVWRDEHGKHGDGYLGNPTGVGKLVKAARGMLRMKGMGGF
ncbi:IQ calmodulin-binding motif protein [Ophiocordyceps sinensis CO18]|uniref:IQ calmodulin-binding motif protein n=1 Tax=Ophiocordyceps sinensis (strain Co18 / CGMCC 3.14243) TaxID=911162 RepID=T5A7P0_OPHSC|nr:IQ calmodulin-binding motif protein [Ophiocordyceps sinensis CO18]